MRKSQQKVPAEVGTSHFQNIVTTFRDARVGYMAPAERKQWTTLSGSALARLQIFQCGIYYEAWNHHWERHRHPEGVLIYCTEGKGYYQQNGRRREILPGDVVYCPPGSHHLYGADAKTPWTIHWMHLFGQDLPHYERICGFGAGGSVTHIGIQREIIETFHRLVERFQPPYDETRLLAILADTLAILSRIAITPAGTPVPPLQTLAIQKAISQMDERLSQPFDLEHYATVAGYHPNYFTRRFRLVTGMPPVAYFNARKMRRACDLLAIPGLQIQEIARRLGYANPFYFSRAFKKIIGKSPDAYRRTQFPGTP